MKSIIRLAVCSLLALAVVTAPRAAFAEDKPAADSKGDKKQSNIPFHGKISAVDKAAKTITLGERTFQVTSETRTMKGGKPATLDDAAVGEEAAGQYRKSDDGKMNLVSLRIGPKPEKAEGAGEKKK